MLLIDINTKASTTKLKENNIDIERKNIGEVLKDNLDINSLTVSAGNNLNLIPIYLTLHSLNGDFIA